MPCIRPYDMLVEESVGKLIERLAGSNNGTNIALAENKPCVILENDKPHVAREKDIRDHVRLFDNDRLRGRRGRGGRGMGKVNDAGGHEVVHRVDGEGDVD